MSETLETLHALETVVIKRNSIGQEIGSALIVAICDAPTYVLVDANGNRGHWRQDLTRPTSHSEALAYWRERAVLAEASHARLLDTLNKATDQNQQLIERLSNAWRHEQP